MYRAITTGNLITCTRRLTFEAGHRVFGHESKCANLHGHSYKVEIEAQAEQLDGVGRIVDFAVLKERVGSWIDNCWDHGFILFEKDGDAQMAIRQLAGQKVYLLDWNPTAENLARFLLERVCPDLLRDTGVTVTRVVLHETENCKAEARLA